MIAAFAGFLMGFIGSMPISGPISLLVFHRGVLARYWDGWAIGLGGAIAEGIYCALAILGLSAMRDRFTFLEPLAKALGILVLFAIGLYFVLARQENPEAKSVGQPSAANWVGQFCLGLSVATLNPTLILTWSASATIVYSIANLTFTTHEAIVFATSVIFGIAAWFGVLLALLRRFREQFPFLMLQRVIRSVGVLLVVTSVAWAASLLLG